MFSLVKAGELTQHDQLDRLIGFYLFIYLFFFFGGGGGECNVGGVMCQPFF